jgi:hypothetical protein
MLDVQRTVDGRNVLIKAKRAKREKNNNHIIINAII